MLRVLQELLGIIRNYYGSPISLRKGSDFQVLGTETPKITIDESRAEIYDSIAYKLIEKFGNSRDNVLRDLKYYSERVIDTRSDEGKKRWFKELLRKVKENEKYLKWMGYLKTIAGVLRAFL